MNRDLLAARARYFEAVRAFFKERGVLEVDCPALSLSSSIDLHIDVMEVAIDKGKTAYLHTSPEYAMKKLLAKGSGDIYQMSHVFRQGEVGPLHSPEFTMVEWYRCGVAFEHFIQETLAFVHLFLPEQTAHRLTYEQAFLAHTRLDPLTAPSARLLQLAEALNLNFSKETKESDRDTLLQILFSALIEPELQNLTVVTDYPAAQAALARTEGAVAKRFEVYFKGIELANGFHELTDAREQEERLHLENKKRQALGKAPLPLDREFLSALEQGLPDCCGVACGFDRLLMLALGTPTLPLPLPLPFTSIFGRWGTDGPR